MNDSIEVFVVRVEPAEPHSMEPVSEVSRQSTRCIFDEARIVEFQGRDWKCEMLYSLSEATDEYWWVQVAGIDASFSDIVIEFLHGHPVDHAADVVGNSSLILKLASAELLSPDKWIRVANGPYDNFDEAWQECKGSKEE